MEKGPILKVSVLKVFLRTNIAIIGLNQYNKLMFKSKWSNTIQITNIKQLK